MKRTLLILSIIALVGALYAPTARADDDNTPTTLGEPELSQNTDEPQERAEDRRIPGQPTPGTAEDPNVYHCGATSACN